jgi:hypothetical protein
MMVSQITNVEKNDRSPATIRKLDSKDFVNKK